jgi:hypothetical protein
MERRIIHRALTACAVSLTLFVTGCTTVQTRLAEHQEAFHAMSPSDQALVQQGKIREGMSHDAVYIAWGSPSQRIPGRFRGHIVETWIYDATAAGDYGGPFLYGYPYGYGIGYGFWGGHRRHLYHGHRYYGHHYYDPFYDPFFYTSANIVRYPERTVSFDSGRVIGWQFLPSPRLF